MAQHRQLLLTSWLVREARAGVHDAPSRLAERGLRTPNEQDVIEIDDSDAEPASDDPVSTLWPRGVDRLRECADPDGVEFRDELGDIGRCSCSAACLRGRCENASAGVFCVADNCAVGLACSNRMEELECLQLVPTHTGLGVATTVPLPPDTVVGEYCGVLRSGAAFTQEMRRAGFGFEFAETSVAGVNVYVDATRAGSLCHFVNHSCVPSCRFEVLVNRASRKVVVVTSELVPAGGELTLRYCGRLWFECRCAACVSRA